VEHVSWDNNDVQKHKMKRREDSEEEEKEFEGYSQGSSVA